VTVRQQVIIRVPRGSGQRRVEASAAPMQWREGAGPRCIQVRQIAGAMPAPQSVDFVLRKQPAGARAPGTALRRSGLL
jgi:hypothetical protein